MTTPKNTLQQPQSAPQVSSDDPQGAARDAGVAPNVTTEETLPAAPRPRLVGDQAAAAPAQPAQRLRADGAPRNRPQNAKLDLDGALRQRRLRQNEAEGPRAQRQDNRRNEAPAPDTDVRPAVEAASFRPRHFRLLMSLAAMVLLPVAISAWYLWTVAVDQYESHAGFSVRAESQMAVPDMLGGLLGPSAGSTAEDMYILNEFIISQEMVEKVDAKLDLRKRFSLPENDPVFAFDPAGSIEDLVSYWERMVVVDHDASTGLMSLTIYAFTPQDAEAIARAVLEESSAAINLLSVKAREDSTRYARDNLEKAQARVAEVRAEVTRFRAVNQISDPTADVASQMGVLSSLQQQLATEMVELDLLRDENLGNDPRVGQYERRIAAIEDRIAEERAKLGMGAEGTGFARILGDFEKLRVDQTFAEQAYLGALATFDAATAKAQQQSRYLATFVQPTLAEASTAPQRPLWLLMIGLCSLFIWASVVLVYYSLRDRR